MMTFGDPSGANDLWWGVGLATILTRKWSRRLTVAARAGDGPPRRFPRWDVATWLHGGLLRRQRPRQAVGRCRGWALL